MAPFPDVKPKVEGDDSYEILDPPIDTTEEIVDPEDDLGFEFPDDCPICDYDLCASRESMVCPECGASIPEEMQKLEDHAALRSQFYAKYEILRWIIFGMIPIALWVPLAFLLYRSDIPGLMWMIIPSGIVLGIGSIMYATTNASDEARNDSMSVAVLVCVSLCTGNLCVFALTLMQLGY